MPREYHLSALMTPAGKYSRTSANQHSLHIWSCLWMEVSRTKLTGQRVGKIKKSSAFWKNPLLWIICIKSGWWNMCRIGHKGIVWGSGGEKAKLEMFQELFPNLYSKESAWLIDPCCACKKNMHIGLNFTHRITLVRKILTSMILTIFIFKSYIQRYLGLVLCFGTGHCFSLQMPVRPVP